MVSQRLGRHKEERGATCMHVDLVGVAARREKKSVERLQACTWGIGEHIKQCDEEVNASWLVHEQWNMAIQDLFFVVK